MRKRTIYLAIGLVVCFNAVSPAAGETNLLSNAGKFKPAIKFGEVYTERLLVTPDEPVPGEPRTYTREVVPNFEKITASLTASLEGLDIAGQIDPAMPVELQFGGLSFSSTLGEADLFNAAAGKAVFRFVTVDSIDRPDGSTIEKQRLAGTISFIWSSRVLKVTLTISDAEGAGLGDIVSSSLVGTTNDNGSAAKLTGQPVDVGVTFGTFTGSRRIYAAGVSKVTVKKFGSDAAGTLEEYPMNSVMMKGSSDVTPPVLAFTVPAVDADGNGRVDFSGTVTELSQSSGYPEPFPVVVSFLLNGQEAVYETLTTGEPDGRGRAAISVKNLQLDPNAPHGVNVLTITAVDGSGNTAILTKKIKNIVVSQASRAGLFVLPDTGATDLAITLVDTRTLSTVAVLTRDEELFGSRFVRGLREMDISTKSGNYTVRFDDEGIPSEVELPGGAVVTFDTASPDLDPHFPGESVAASFRHSVRGVTGDSLRERFRILNPGDFFDKNDISNTGIPGFENVAAPLVEFVEKSFDLMNEHLERVIEIGAARNPLLFGLNELRELRDTVADHLDSIDNAVKVSSGVLEQIGSLDFQSPGWFDSIKSTLQSGLGSLGADAPQILLERTKNSGFWSATVWWARDPSWDDTVWANASAIVQQQINAVIDPSVVSVQFRNSGFVVTWNRIPTSDFSAIREQMQSAYGAAPWTLNGPYLSQ